MGVVKVIQVRSDLPRVIDYVSQAYKTNSGLLLSSNCVLDASDSAMVRAAFDVVDELAAGAGLPVGRASVIAHHVIQSFAPGECSPEVAHRLGEEFARRITGDDYSWVLATHVDREHVHNHLVVQARNRETLRQLRMPKGRLFEWRGVSDELCREYGLSVVETRVRGRERLGLGEVYARVRGASAKDALRLVIDQAVVRSSTWEEFVDLLADWNVEVAFRGREITFRDVETMQRAVRGWRLGVAYEEGVLASRLGRDVMAPFSVSKNLIVDESESSYVVRVPGTRGVRCIRVGKANCVDAGAVLRFYVNSNVGVSVFDRGGQFLESVSTVDLYQWFERPSRKVRVVPGEQSVELERRRGVSVGQRRYFAVQDRKLARLLADAASFNMAAALGRVSRVELERMVTDLDGALTQLDYAREKLVADRQRAIDADEVHESFDERLDEMNEQIRSVHERLEAVKNMVDSQDRHREKGAR